MVGVPDTSLWEYHGVPKFSIVKMSCYCRKRWIWIISKNIYRIRVKINHFSRGYFSVKPPFIIFSQFLKKFFLPYVLIVILTKLQGLFYRPQKSNFAVEISRQLSEKFFLISMGFTMGHPSIPIKLWLEDKKTRELAANSHQKATFKGSQNIKICDQNLIRTYKIDNPMLFHEIGLTINARYYC